MLDKIIKIIGNVCLYFISVLLVALIFDKIWGLGTSVIEYAILLTIGWCIWKGISYCVKRIAVKEKEKI